MLEGLLMKTRILDRNIDGASAGPPPDVDSDEVIAGLSDFRYQIASSSHSIRIVTHKLMVAPNTINITIIFL